MILVDSSVWVDYFRGKMTPQTDKLDLLLGHEALAIGDLILAEVLQGFDSDRDFKSAQRLLTSSGCIEIGGVEIAIQAAKTTAQLRRRGVTIRKTVDAMIATRCIESGYDLLHCDRDFDPFAAYLGLNAIA